MVSNVLMSSSPREYESKEQRFRNRYGSRSESADAHDRAGLANGLEWMERELLNLVRRVWRRYVRRTWPFPSPRLIQAILARVESTKSLLTCYLLIVWDKQLGIKYIDLYLIHAPSLCKIEGGISEGERAPFHLSSTAHLFIPFIPYDAC